jgi:hypothetical protein
MPYRTEIEKTLDELIADEAGMKFQGVAVVPGQAEVVASGRERAP